MSDNQKNVSIEIGTSKNSWKVGNSEKIVIPNLTSEVPYFSKTNRSISWSQITTISGEITGILSYIGNYNK